MPTAATAAISDAAPAADNGPMLLLLALIGAIAAWFVVRAALRSLRAQKTQAATGGDFTSFSLEALVNAARIDGRVKEEERRAVAQAMRQLAGPDFDPARVDVAFASARLSKEDLVDFLAAHCRAFSSDQKAELLKGLLAVFTADADFDAAEHTALVEYTAAIGFDRHTAPETLRRLAHDMAHEHVIT